MTQDAFTQAQALTHQIHAATALLNRHLAKVNELKPDLTAAQLATLTTAIHAIHDPVIAGLQTSFTNLPGTYTAPVPNP
jgi:hypothetical protein